MKYVKFLLPAIFILLVTVCARPKVSPQENPEIFEVKTTKWPMSVDNIYRMVLGPSGDNPRAAIYPALYLIGPKGIIRAKGQELVKENINSVFEKYLGQR
jgi:hypothetical protein